MLDKIAAALNNPIFYWGLLVGLVIGMFFWMYGAVLRVQNLRLSADGNTATKLGNEFYYIVPERDYIKLSREALNWPDSRPKDEEGSGQGFRYIDH